jgi:hypothetical protein
VAKAERERLIKAGPKFFAEQVAQIADEGFIAAVKEYRGVTEQLFRRTETVRMPLAKHEVAKISKKKLAAEAPGTPA